MSSYITDFAMALKDMSRMRSLISSGEHNLSIRPWEQAHDDGPPLRFKPKALGLSNRAAVQPQPTSKQSEMRSDSGWLGKIILVCWDSNSRSLFD
jgi:hypothetical protein